MRSRSSVPWLIALLLVALLSPFAAQAQSDGPTIQIHGFTTEPITTAVGTSLALKVTFSLLDANRQSLASEIQAAALEVGGEVYTPTLTSVETGWSIVFVVDASKAMADVRTSSALKTVRAAIPDAIGKAPRDSLFAVIQFNDQAPTIQEFTPKSEDIANALKSRWQPKNVTNACLNDGLNEAVNKLSGVPRKRAIILFTASGDNCARPAQSVIDFAAENDVQIYAVGLEGAAITRQELDNFSSATTGLADVRPENELRFALDNIMAVLSNQRLAAASLFTQAGPQIATLKLTLADTTQLVSPSIQFQSDQDYVRPPAIRIKGTVISEGRNISFGVEATNEAQIKRLNISVLRKDTEQPVITQSLEQTSGTITIPAVTLTRGTDYILVVAAVDEVGRPLSEDVREFRYEPELPSLVVSDVSAPTLEAPQFIITVTAQNLEGVVKYKVWLADAESTEQTPIAGTERIVSLGDPIVISADDLASGSFLVFVQALDSAGTILAEATPAKTRYERPSALMLFINSISGSPWAIAGLTGVCCLAGLGLLGLVWLILPKRSTKVKTVDLVLPEKARRAAPPPEPEPRRPEPRPQAPPQRPPEPPLPAPRPEPVKAEAPKPAPAPAPQPAAAPPSSAPTVRATMPVAVLTLSEPATPKFTAQITKVPFTIGRREGNDAVLPVDNSSGVSGRHFTITFADGHFLAQDDKSTFGTTLNGQAIPKGKPARLEDGVTIGLGPNVKLQFRVMK